jgi:uncharacterized protein with HEPN domain
MTRENDRVRIRHILDAACEAVGFAEVCSREDLDSDRKLSLSLVRLLEIIGEAARGSFAGVSGILSGAALGEYGRYA